LAHSTRTHWRNVVTVASIMVLVGVEIFGVALAGGWAVAGLFELGTTMGYVLMALFSLFGAYLLLILWRHCVAVEPLAERA